MSSLGFMCQVPLHRGGGLGGQGGFCSSRAGGKPRSAGSAVPFPAGWLVTGTVIGASCGFPGLVWSWHAAWQVSDGFFFFYCSKLTVFVGLFFQPSANSILLVLVLVVERGTHHSWCRKGRAPSPLQSLSCRSAPGQTPLGQTWGVNRSFF